MKNFLFLIPLVALVITAGCVIQNNNPPVPPTPQIVYVTVLVTPIPTHQIVYTAPKDKVVAATAQQIDATHMIVTYQGGQDASTCIAILWTVTLSSGSATSTVMGSTSLPASPLIVGTTATLPATADKDHLVGTAYFSDGSTQVIFDNSL
jgi:hypothetical protein